MSVSAKAIIAQALLGFSDYVTKLQVAITSFHSKFRSSDSAETS
jgi:heme A synthase